MVYLFNKNVQIDGTDPSYHIPNTKIKMKRKWKWNEMKHNNFDDVNYTLHICRYIQHGTKYACKLRASEMDETNRKKPEPKAHEIL